jgi:hypothetical protein
LPDGEKSLIGDIIITDATLAQKVLDGQLREVSLGYSCEYVPNGDGTWDQRKLRTNHCALVPDGRAGEHVRIYDAAFIGSFAEMVKQFHRRNPSEVAASTAEQRATDRLPDALLRGEPQSWDELARTLTGEEMPKKSKDESPELHRLIEVLEDYFDNNGEKEEQGQTPESRALQHLRAIKPAIQSSGDRKAIDAYNSAVRSLKAARSARTVLVSDMRRGQATVDDEEYGRSMTKFHRQNARDVDHSTARRSCASDETIATYDDVDVAADYEKRIRETRERMLREKQY